MDAPDFPTFCSELLGEPITNAWADFFRVVEGLPVANESFVNECMGRDHYTARVYPETTGICGRRSEKTASALKYLLWKALYAGWEQQGSWFTRATRRRLRIPIIAQDTRVSHDIKRMAEALVLDSAVVSQEVDSIRKSEILFKNGLSLIVLPASKASVRGLTCPACLLDELAWVSIDGADDKELVRQVRPSMIQFGTTRRLLKMSTPWQRSGILYDEFSGRDSRPELMVWQASTQMMTHRISAEELERERVSDPVYFAREYEAQFTTDLECFLPWPDIHVAVQHWTELAPEAEATYFGSLDASGLTGGDSFTFGIGHRDEGGFLIVDVLRGWRKAAVPQVCDEIASLCKLYRVSKIIADQFSFPFVSELMRQREIGMEQVTFSARSKPEIHFDLKNMLAQAKIQLPNHPEMIRELRALESVRTSGGNYKIGAPRGLNDDYVSVLAILANKAKRSTKKFFMPEVWELRPWVDPQAGKNLDDPYLELSGERWHKW